MQQLIDQERIARLNKDESKIKAVFLEMYNNCSNIEEVISLLRSLSRRKGQLTNPFKEFIHGVFIEKSKNLSENDFVDFCKCLLTEVIEGKMYLESERLFVTIHLKDYYMKYNNLREALDAIYDVPVETFTSISEVYIFNFLLEQLRLSILNEELMKADLTNKKISKRIRNVNYRYLKIIFDMKMSNYLSVSRGLLDVGVIRYNVFLSSFFILLSGDTKDKRNLDIIEDLILNNNNFEEVRNVLKVFMKNEIIDYKVMNSFIKIYNEFNVNDTINIDTVLSIDNTFYIYQELLTGVPSIVSLPNDESKGCKCKNGELYDLRTFDANINSRVDLNEYIPVFRTSIDNHNLKVISKFCTILSLKSIGDLLNCTETDATNKIRLAVEGKILKCSINQSKGIVRFNDSLEPNWMEGIDEVLDKVVEVNYLIHEEKLVN